LQSCFTPLCEREFSSATLLGKEITNKKGRFQSEKRGLLRALQKASRYPKKLSRNEIEKRRLLCALQEKAMIENGVAGKEEPPDCKGQTALKGSGLG